VLGAVQYVVPVVVVYVVVVVVVVAVAVSENIYVIIFRKLFSTVLINIRTQCGEQASCKHSGLFLPKFRFKWNKTSDKAYGEIWPWCFNTLFEVSEWFLRVTLRLINVYKKFENLLTHYKVKSKKSTDGQMHAHTSNQNSEVKNKNYLSNDCNCRQEILLVIIT